MANLPEGKFMVSVGAVIKNIKTGKFLLLKNPGADKWTYVSGRMKQGEEFSQALNREIEEETGLKVDIIRLVSAWHGYRGEKIEENELIVLSYLCHTQTEDVKISDEHEEYKWVNGNEVEGLISPGLYSSIQESLS